MLWIAIYTKYFHQSHKRPEITRFKIAGEGRVDEYKEGYTNRWLETEIHGQENGQTDIQKDKKQKQITCIPCS